MKPATLVWMCRTSAAMLSALWLINLARCLSRPVVNWFAALGSPILLVLVLTLVTLGRVGPAVDGSASEVLPGKSRPHGLIGVVAALGLAAFVAGFWAGVR